MNSDIISLMFETEFVTDLGVIETNFIGFDIRNKARGYSLTNLNIALLFLCAVRKT